MSICDSPINQTSVAQMHVDLSVGHGLPGSWAAWVTPEGDTYFTDLVRRIVTPVDPRSSGAQNIFDATIKTLARLVDLTKLSNVEIFVNFSDGRDAVEYYFVFHKEHLIAWAEDVDVAALGLMPFTASRGIGGSLYPSGSRLVLTKLAEGSFGLDSGVLDVCRLVPESPKS